jgi:hypothetical protein
MYRWNPLTAKYECFFRGPIGRTEDTVSETTHTVNVTAADYRAMLARCILNTPWTFTQRDQLVIFNFLLGPGSSTGPFPNLAIVTNNVLNPDGSFLAGNATGVLRDRTYTGAEKCGDMLDNLSKVSNGFDWGIVPIDPLDPSGLGIYAGYHQMWYPQQGITKPFIAEYGATVTSLTRTVNSSDFANWIRNDGQTNNNVPLYAISPGDVMANPQLHAEGLWQEGISNADVSDPNTLQQQADGELAFRSQLMPSYTIQLVPGAWKGKTDCWLGDSVSLRVVSGRLNVNTTARIIAIDFDIGDDGAERVALTVGRDTLAFSELMADHQSQLDALTRR